jgi:serine/threonine protein kinase
MSAWHGPFLDPFGFGVSPGLDETRAGPLRPEGSATNLLVASILDRYQGTSPYNSEYSLARQIKTGAARDLHEAVARLPDRAREDLFHKVSKAELSQWIALAGDGDRASFFNGVLSFGDRLFREGKTELATWVHGALEQALSQPDFAALKGDAALMKRLQGQRELLNGEGPWRERLPVTLNRLGDEFFSPLNLIGIPLGNLVNGGARMAAYLRSAKRVESMSRFARSWGVHAGAAAVGMGAELAVWAGLAHGLAHVTGRDDSWSSQELLRQGLGTAFMLWGARGAGLATGLLLGKVPSAAGLGWRAAHFAIPQGAMLLSMMGLHGVEVGLGWRDAKGGVDLAAESLLNLFYLHGVGKLVAAALGPAYVRMTQGLHLNIEGLRHQIRQGVSRAHLGLQAFLPRSAVLADGPAGVPPVFGGSSLHDGLWRATDHIPPQFFPQGGTPRRGSVPAPITSPQTVGGGRYEVVDWITAGGWAHIYEARDRQLEDLPVALKVSSHTEQSAPVFIERLRREARAMAAMGGEYHPAVYNFFRLETGHFAMALELIDGYSLAEMIPKIHGGDLAPHFPLERRLGLLVQLCRGVELAHSKGIIHRDLKPENVMWSGALGVPALDKIYLLDYGLLKRVGVPARRSAAASQLAERNEISKEESPITQAGQMAGTRGYIPPEMIYLKEIPSQYAYQGDVFTLGVTSFELITGILPTARFRPDVSGPLALIAQRRPNGDFVVDERFQQYVRPDCAYPVAPLPSMRQVIHADQYDPRLTLLNGIVSKAMALSPSNRYRSVRAYRRALEKAMESLPK